MSAYLLVFVLISNVILLTQSMPDRWASYNRAHENSAVNDTIIFPDGYSTQIRFGTSKEIDFSATGKGLNCTGYVCEDAKEYPYDRIKEVIGSLSVYHKLFGFLEGNVVEVKNKFGPDGEPDSEETMCATNTLTRFPKTMRNENKTEKFIVNDDDHKQGLVIETCVENGKCKFHSRFPEKYTSECRQKYARRRLMALEADGNPAFDFFIVPSCCVCTIKQIK